MFSVAKYYLGILLRLSYSVSTLLYQFCIWKYTSGVTTTINTQQSITVIPNSNNNSNGFWNVNSLSIYTPYTNLKYLQNKNNDTGSNITNIQCNVVIEGLLINPWFDTLLMKANAWYINIDTIVIYLIFGSFHNQNRHLFPIFYIVYVKIEKAGQLLISALVII